LNVQIGKLLEWTHFLWREFRDSLVNRDRFGQESVADEELRQPLKVFDGLKGFRPGGCRARRWSSADLVARLVLQNLLILRDGLRHFALVQQLLRGFDVFALV